MDTDPTEDRDELVRRIDALTKTVEALQARLAATPRTRRTVRSWRSTPPARCGCSPVAVVQPTSSSTSPATSS